MVNWRRGVGSVYTGKCAFFYMWNIVSVVVFHRSMVNWRRGGVCLHRYLYIHLYVKCSQCSGFSIDLWLIGGGGRVCLHWYLSIFWYLKHSLCSGLPEIYGWLEEGLGSVCHETDGGVVVFQRSMVDWRREGEVCLHWYQCIYLYVKHSVVVLHRSMVNWRRGWVSLPWNCCSVVVFQRSMVNWGREWGLSALVSVHASICEM